MKQRKTLFTARAGALCGHVLFILWHGERSITLFL